MHSTIDASTRKAEVKAFFICSFERERKERMITSSFVLLHTSCALAQCFCALLYMLFKHSNVYYTSQWIEVLQMVWSIRSLHEVKLRRANQWAKGNIWRALMLRWEIQLSKNFWFTTTWFLLPMRVLYTLGKEYRFPDYHFSAKDDQAKGCVLC